MTKHGGYGSLCYCHAFGFGGIRYSHSALLVRSVKCKMKSINMVSFFFGITRTNGNVTITLYRTHLDFHTILFFIHIRF